MRSLVSVTTSTGETLNAVAGGVELDSRRSITRTCTLELAPTDTLTKADIYDLVMTPSIEITVKRGLLVNGVAEYVPLGVFSTDNAKRPHRTGTVSWAGSDRAKKISRAKFTDAYSIASGASLADAGTALLTSRLNSVVTNFSNVNTTIAAPIVYDTGADPWEQARRLFADYGYDLHFDGTGTAVASVIADPATVASVFDFGSGDTQLVLGGDTTGTLEKTYNGVIATGEGSSVTTPVRYAAWDTDPTSPTYYLSGFGMVPLFYSSPLITTEAAAQLAAQALLAKLKGRTEQVAWPAVVNPALEPLDVVTVELDRGTSRLVLDKLTIPLKASDAMSCAARETSTV